MAGFNPHPRMGGDNSNFHQWSHLVSFNPHPRMGGDDDVYPHDYIVIKVSIHTPVWGVTEGYLRAVYPRYGFNPRPRMGGDNTMW